MKWLWEQFSKIRTIDDKPVAIARGIAIGTLFGFLPILGFKTLLAIILTRICRGNLIATAVAVTLHDILLPLAPFFLIWEYKIGCRILGKTPVHLDFHQGLHEILRSIPFFSLEPALIIGGAILGLPIAVASYFLTLFLIPSPAASDVVEEKS